MLNIISALDLDRGIGYRNRLLVHIPEDLRRFKRLTSGHPLVMGHETFKSLPRVLPRRQHLVLSRQVRERPHPLVEFHQSLASALEKASSLDSEVYVIGGANVYAQCLPLADRLLLTCICAHFPADRRFPPIPREFVLTKQENPKQFEGVGYQFLEYARE